TIPDTLRHVVEAEEDYFSVLTGEHASEPFPAGPVRLEELARRLHRLALRWEVVAQDIDLPGHTVTFPDGVSWPGAVLLAQAIHYAADHRTHILSMLGARAWRFPVWMCGPTPNQLASSWSRRRR